MLKSHQNLLTPRPSDRVRVGDCIVDLSLREISRDTPGSEPTRISVKAQGVLIALIAHAGKVVSREALLEWVWPDTMPNDDVVTQAITLLRKTFGDTREQTAYIETISKHGYRLVAQVEWIMPADAALVPEPVPDSRTDAEARPLPAAWLGRRGKTVALMAVVVLGVGLAAGALWSVKPLSIEVSPAKSPGSPSTEEDYLRIASSPDPEYGPTLSPDGSLLAYVRYPQEGAALYVQTASALPPKALTERVKGRDDLMPTWSPNGREIAFQRRSAQGCAVMLMAATGGNEREIGECLDGEMHQMSWYPDGKTLIAAGAPTSLEGSDTTDASDTDRGKKTRDGHGSVLYRMAIEEGRWQPIVYSRNPNDIDTEPAVSPDGRWIAFHRNAALGDLWRVPGTGGTPERLTYLETNIFGLAWAADGKAVVFSRMASGEKRLSRVDIDSGRIADYRLKTGSFEYPAVAFDSGAIAFQIEEEHSRLQRLSVGEGPQAYARWRTVYETTGTSRLPSVSPDGEQIVFASDRSGEGLLWWARREDPDSLRPIEGFHPAPRFAPVWDPASQRLIAIGDGAQGVGLYEIDPQHGRAEFQPVPEIEPVYAAYHPDPRRLLVIGTRGDGLLGLFLFDRSVRPWRKIATIEGDIGVVTADRADARVVYVQRSKPEIWATNLDLGQPRQVDALEKRGRGRLKTLTATTDGVWVLDGRPDCIWYLRRVAREPGETLPGAQCLGGDPDIQLEGGSYDPKHREFYLGIREYPIHDIGLLPPENQKEKIQYVKAVRN